MDAAFPSTVPVGVLVLLADTSIELRNLGQRIAKSFVPGDDVHQPAIDIIVALFARLTSARSPVNAVLLDSTASTVMDLWAVIPGILAQLSPGCIKTRLVIKGMNLYITRPVFANLAGVESTFPFPRKTGLLYTDGVFSHAQRVGLLHTFFDRSRPESVGPRNTQVS